MPIYLIVMLIFLLQSAVMSRQHTVANHQVNMIITPRYCFSGWVGIQVAFGIDSLNLVYMYYCIYSESSDGSESSIEYFKGDIELPIVSRQNRMRTSSLHTVRAILDTPQDLVSTKHPTQININCAFVIDT